MRGGCSWADLSRGRGRPFGGKTARRPRRAQLAPAHPPAITALSRRARPGRTQRLLVVRRARWRTADQARTSTAAEETAYGVHAPAGDVLAKRPDWQARRRVWGRGWLGPAGGLRRVAAPAMCKGVSSGTVFRAATSAPAAAAVCAGERVAEAIPRRHVGTGCEERVDPPQRRAGSEGRQAAATQEAAARRRVGRGGDSGVAGRPALGGQDAGGAAWRVHAQVRAGARCRRWPTR